LLTYWSFGLTQAGLKAALLASALLVLLFTDLELQKLPDAITLPGFVVGLLLALWIPVQDGSAKGLAGFLGLHMPPLAVSFTDALIGALFGAGFLILARQLYFWLRRREGLGLGDVKMMAMLGAFLGLKQVILIVFFSSLAGSIFSIPMFFMILVRFLVDPRQKTVWRRFSNSRKKPISRVRLSIVKVGRTPIPYGVFLALAALVAIFWGRPLVKAYLGLFR
ncbi:MAG: prepilin peptidase, partial [Terriglobia bacterium]